MDGLSLAASVIAIIQISGSCLKLCSRYVGPSKFGSKDLTAIVTTLYDFNGALAAFQIHLEIFEDDEARLSSLAYFKPALERSKETVQVVESFMTESSFLTKHFMGPKFDARLKASLGALDGAKELFRLAVPGDQQ